MVGYRFGEFTWTRKIALYKAKQLRKKKKKVESEIWTCFENILD